LHTGIGKLFKGSPTLKKGAKNASPKNHVQSQRGGNRKKTRGNEQCPSGLFPRIADGGQPLRSKKKKFKRGSVLQTRKDH